MNCGFIREKTHGLMKNQVFFINQYTFLWKNHIKGSQPTDKSKECFYLAKKLFNSMQRIFMDDKSNFYTHH